MTEIYFVILNWKTISPLAFLTPEETYMYIAHCIIHELSRAEDEKKLSAHA